jgi:hypothetical protein
MDLTLTEPERLFRDELRVWLADNDPGEMPAGEQAVYAWRRDFQRRLADGGRAADAHWLYKRAQLDAALVGGARRHRAALARHGAARAADPVRM